MYTINAEELAGLEAEVAASVEEYDRMLEIINGMIASNDVLQGIMGGDGSFREITTALLSAKRTCESNRSMYQRNAQEARDRLRLMDRIGPPKGDPRPIVAKGAHAVYSG